MSGHNHSSGRVMSRREALARFGAGVLSLTPFVAARATDASAASCIATAEQTEGPYFVDERLRRADIRSDPTSGAIKDGVPLRLRLVVQSISAKGCVPLAGAVVDLWQCDAAGAYSDVSDAAFNTRGQKFLRGYQVTDASGRVEFVTLYPGWYPGRTAHIHFKIRGDGPASRNYAFTSQFYFDDAISDRVFARGPYAGRGPRAVRNNRDFIYRDGGRDLTLPVLERDGGFEASFGVGLRMA
jgi:protocatechuate 3,4-dioxygenase beta subunit